MGLDMYLRGRKGTWSVNEEHCRYEDGFQVVNIELDIGYWRKHPNLHGYIVKNFANGIDDCQDISLTAEDLEKILEAVLNDDLPKTGGFFFGESDSADEQDTVEKLNSAITWLKTQSDKHVFKEVYYSASW